VVDPNSQRVVLAAVIDFRYHIISLVAVFLALGVGILLGSATFGQNLTKRLRGSIENVRTSNERLRDENSDANARIQNDDDFAAAVEPVLLDDILLGEAVVLIDIGGSDPTVLENSRAAIQTAGGSVTATVTLTPALGLEAEEDRLRLGEIIRSSTTDPDDLRAEMGRTLGTRAAIAVAEPGDGNLLRVAADRRFQRLLDDLQQAGFVQVSDDDDEGMVGPSTSFVVGGGSATVQAPYETEELSIALTEGLATREAEVVAVQPRNSLWGPASAVRSDGDVANVVSSVDQADVTVGRIAVAMALDLADKGAPCHYGSERNASCGVIPEPAPNGP
jgi:Copper transport outer membrane protein, MctB